MDFLRRITLLYYIIQKFQWQGIFKYYDKKSENIIWIHPSFPKNIIKYVLGLGTLIHDTALINAFVVNKKKFRIRVGKSILTENNKNIFYSISHFFNPTDLLNHSEPLVSKIKLLEKSANILFPNSYEASYWENKAFMYVQFEKLNINHPKTKILEIGQIPKNEVLLQFPFLIKEIHSAGSVGVHKVVNLVEFKSLIRKLQQQGQKEIIIQELIDMRKDLRVTLVGDKVVLSYWRINPNVDEWRPTSTMHGSNTIFGDFPLQWEKYLIDQFKKLNLTTGAFDVTWQHDDVNTEPIILEVSPAYQPNPTMPKSKINLPYKVFKNSIFGKDSYNARYVTIVNRIKKDLISVYKF